MDSVYPNIQQISIHRLVPYYIMSSYLYYVKDKQVLDDTDYDALCKRLLENWDDVKHPHKRRIRKGWLVAGTGYTMRYTNMMKSAAEQWYMDWEKERENVNASS